MRLARDGTMLVSNLLINRAYPDELLNLYNPAYIGAVIYLSGCAYQSKVRSPMPIYFPFVAVPLVCVDACRERLPEKVGKVTDWARQNADVLFDFPQRALALKPFVSSGLVFLNSNGLVSKAQDASNFKFASSKKLIVSLQSLILSSEYVRNELDRATVAGRLLASNWDVSTVLTVFGLKP